MRADDVEVAEDVDVAEDVEVDCAVACCDWANVIAQLIEKNQPIAHRYRRLQGLVKGTGCSYVELQGLESMAWDTVVLIV